MNRDNEIVNILTKNFLNTSELTPKCDQCSKSVYMLEELKIKDKTFHKSCFKCNICNKLLDKNNYHNEIDSNEFYCRNCFTTLNSSSSQIAKSKINKEQDKQKETNQTFFKIVIKKPVSNYLNENKAEFLSGYDTKSSQWTKNYFQHSSISYQSKPSEKVVLIQSNNCTRCNKAVYMIEELKLGNKLYHKLCFKCSVCNKLLETKTSIQHQGDLFCKSCYGKNFGPSVFSNGVIDESDLIINTVSEKSAFNPYLKSNEDQNVVSIKQLANIYSQNKIEPKIEPKLKTKIEPIKDTNVTSNKKLANINVQNKVEPKIEPIDDDQNVVSLANIRHLANIYSQNKIEARLEPKKKSTKRSENHVKFNETVIVNEEIRTELSSSPDLDHFNANHYKKDNPNDNRLLDSPKMFDKFNQNNSDDCTRCGKTVYAAEKFLGGKKIYHLNCFKCIECNKKLNLSNYFENNDEIYCKFCVNGKQSVMI